MERQIEEQVEDRIREVVEKELARLGTSDISFAVEWPADMAHGDFAVNAALASSKELGKSPRDIAEELVPALRDELGSDISSIEIAGPGFINLTLSKEAIARTLNEVKEAGMDWGKNDRKKGKSIMIEYGNPNPFKEMHIGHLVSTIIGESLSRLSEFERADVLRDTFGGDVGPQVAKALWPFLKDGATDIASAGEIGTAYIKGANAYEESDVAKKEIDELNVRIYNVVASQDAPETLSEDDRTLLYLWQKGREITMGEFGEIFAKLGTRFDYTFFDSDTTEPGMHAVQDAVSRGILQESEGAIIYPGEEKGLHTLVFVTSRGTPTYETKDIGLAILKEMRAPTDHVIVLTASEQIGHFKVVLAALSEIAPALAEKTQHLVNGILTLTTGKMSSRKGNIITAREFINDLIEKASERNEDILVAEQVAIAALKYMILRSAPGGNIVFDPEKSLSLDGDSGPYLQYSLVRARSILAKAGGEANSIDVSADDALAPMPLARLITRFPGTVAKAQILMGPHVVVQYLTQLASEWNSFYANERIIGEPDEAAKLALVRAFVTTMENGLWLLGIPAPESM